MRQWTEKVRNFDRTYRTENGVFYIDCSGIHDNLIPKLSQIFRELCTFVAEESVTLAKTFSEEMKKVTKVTISLCSLNYTFKEKRKEIHIAQLYRI